MSRAGVLIRADALRVGRDPMFLLLSALPLALAGAARLGAPAALERLPAAVDGGAAASGATAVLLLLTPMMFGFVIGLLLLDERDEGVLTAVALTPVGKTGFLGYRMATPVVWSGTAAVLVVLLTGMVSFAPGRLATLALLAGLQTPILALFLGAFAADKVRGMALGKVGSVLIGIGALAAMAPEPWRWLAVPSPHFWLVHLAIGEAGATGAGASAAGRSSFWLEAAVAATVHAGVLWSLARRFRARAG